jgi:SAM-dependent methyltransferase
MACSCCAFDHTVDQQFTREKVAKELRRYQRKGLGRTARLLRDSLSAARLTSGTLLDVGAGVGALTFALLDEGMTRGTVVEASAAYLAAASEETTRRDRSAAVHFVHGDYVAVGPQVPGATIVTLDRVVCCYPLFEPLLEQAARHARKGDRALVSTGPLVRAAGTLVREPRPAREGQRISHLPSRPTGDVPGPQAERIRAGEPTLHTSVDR